MTLTENLAALVGEIEQLVMNRPPEPDEDALARIREICFTIAHSDRSSGDIREKTVAIESQAEIYFSVRKHERYAQGGGWGAEGFVRMNVLRPCYQLRMALREGPTR